MDESISIFDRKLLRARRDRSAPVLHDHDFLLRETGERLADRLEDIARTFPRAVEIGAHTGLMRDIIGQRGGIEVFIQCDASRAMAERIAPDNRLALVADEEALPFAAASVDLVISNLSLHWVNDLPGTLLQIRHALRPDGLFLGAMLGAGTLAELRVALTEAEIAERGGASPRISPFAELRDAAGLLQRAGFALPVADLDTITVSYADPLRLMRDLRGMGEANAVAGASRKPLSRSIVARAAALYRERFGDAEGRVPATFQVIFVAGWAPHGSQQKALRPGTGRARLADALGAAELPAGQKAPPQ